jgi:ABC-type sugar transport system permease subunit
MKEKFFKSKHNYTWKQWVFYFAVLALPILQFLIFYVYVNANSILFSFQSYEIKQGEFQWNSDIFYNFKQVFDTIEKTEYVKNSFKNALIVLFAKIAVGTTLALLFSYYIFKKRLGAELFKTFLFLPSIISPVCLVIIFTYLADKAVPAAATLLGYEMNGLLTYLDALFPTLLIYALYMGFGYQVLLYSGAMSGVSQSTLEAATLDGANALQEFIYVVLPGVWGTFTTFIVVQFASMFTEQMNLFSFYGGAAPYNTQTVGYYLYVQAQTNANVYTAYPVLAAFGLLLTVITLIVTLFVKKLLSKIGPQEE